MRRQSFECLYAAYKGLGDYQRALAYLEQIKDMEIDMHEQSTEKFIQYVEFRNQEVQDSLVVVERETQLKQAYNEQVQKERQRKNYLAGIGLILLLSVGGVYSRMRYIKRSKAMIEREKNRSESLLLNILPREVAEELKLKGESEARDFDNVTVLFTDFVSFTQTAEKLSAKELVNEINECFKVFDSIMGKYQLEKIKTIGDAYMAAGGLHTPRISEPRDVVLAAIEMQTFMMGRKAEKEAQGLPAFDMRVGIHTGPVVAGIVGVKKFQYDIWGDTVNTASRMESHGEKGKVNISNATYERIQDDPQFKFESRGKVEVKGKGEMAMLFVSLNKNQNDE